MNEIPDLKIPFLSNAHPPSEHSERGIMLSKNVRRSFFESAKPATNAAILQRGYIVGIEYPKAGQIRFRKVVTRSRARATGKHVSWKMGRMMQWESPGERNAFRILDADPEVRGYREQPLEIRYVLDGDEHRHVPDLLIDWKSNQQQPSVAEVKCLADSRRSAVADRTALMQAALPQFGYSYLLMIAEDLRAEPNLANALTLRAYGLRPVSMVARERVRQVLLQTETVAWESACNGDLGPQGREVLSRMYLEGDLHFDTTTRISAMTRFGAKKGLL